MGRLVPCRFSTRYLGHGDERPQEAQHAFLAAGTGALWLYSFAYEAGGTVKQLPTIVALILINASDWRWP